MVEYADANWFFKRRVGRYDVRQIMIAVQWYKLFRPTRVFDLGCGIGSYLSAFDALGCEVAGCDIGMEQAKKYARRTIAKQLFTWDATALMSVRRGWDLVLCQDIIEHIPKAQHGNVWKNLNALGRGAIIFSGGLVGQPGYGHVACQGREQWIEDAEAAGLEWQANETSQLIFSLDEIGDPLKIRDRVLVFRRKAP